MSGQQQLDLLTKKIIAYFHDPPWKAWAITGRLGGGGHEEQALNLLKELGIDINENELPNYVIAADRLASTIDRWITSEVYEIERLQPQQEKEEKQQRNRQRSGLVHFFDKVNMFVPSKLYRGGNGVDFARSVDLDKVKTYISKLVGIVRGSELSYNNQSNQKNGNIGETTSVIDEKLKYHLLYFSAPLLWYVVFPYVPPLADTRVPTHTVFDHATATAAMLNILDCDENNELKFKGYLAVIEIPSIQEFISFSRKARDLWASSWLTSALLWKSVEGFVERFGPDVVLRPELSLNHFFIAWLYNKVNNENTKRCIKELAAKFAYMNGNPTIAMMTEKVFLVLPETASNDGGRDEVGRILKEAFRKAWSDIAREVLLGIDIVSQDDKIVSYILKAIEFPPIEPVVNVISVEEKFNEFSNKLGLPRKIKCPNTYRRGSGFSPVYLLFFEYLFNEVKKYKRPKRVYGSLLSSVIYDVTKERDYKLCTMCGLLPSAYNYYSNNGREEIRTEGTVMSQEVNPDDRLCPYCAVKRMLKGEKVLKVMEKLGLKVYDWEKEKAQKSDSEEKEKKPASNVWRFPSTSELAMADYAYHRAIKKGGNEKKTNLLDYLNAAFKGDETEEDLSEKACGCYSGNLESCKSFTDEDRKLMKEYGNIYYAIIKGDADFMNKGYWSGNLNEATISEYIQQIVESLEEAYDIEERKSVKKFADKLKEVENEIKEKITEARKKLYDRQDEKSFEWIPLTMSYAYTLSRALTVQAVLDKKVLEQNFAVPIYLGGDDLLALAPLKVGDRYPAIEAVMKAREAYWKYPDDSPHDGFKFVNCMVVDSLRAYGRSFAVFVAHYKDPMTLSISVAKWLLEQKYKVHDKDVLLISSGRGASGFVASALKFSDKQAGSKVADLNKAQVELVLEFLKLMDEGKVSKNLIYDVTPILDYSKEKEAVSSGVYSNLVFRLVKRNASGEQIPNEMEERLRKVVGKLFKCTNSNDHKGLCETREAFINVILAVSHLR